MTKK
ncbi:Protein of unknown function [Leuconostoc citreum LBAE C10]|jgi:hypothetical protein